MAKFIKASRKRQLDEWKFLANVGYSTGCLGSMALAKRRPRFEEMFNFPKEDVKRVDIESSKSQMIVWAEKVNREARKSSKGGK